MNKLELQHHQQLWAGAFNGNYPAGTTAQDLANSRNESGNTALHLAASHGQLPPHTTVADLYLCVNSAGHNALRTACINHRQPPEFTTNDYLACKDTKGNSAIFEIVEHGKIPSDATAQQLQACFNSDHVSAWELLQTRCSLHPDTLTNDIPPGLFHDQIEVAASLCQTALARPTSQPTRIAHWMAQVADFTLARMRNPTCAKNQSL